MTKLTPVVLVLTIVMINTVPGSAPLYAQQTQQQAVQQEQETEASDEPAENETGTNTDQTSDEQADSDLPDIDNQPIQAGSGGPGRFIPSEQISQDLGVSFPVDI